jgi:hypothetical protein
MDETTKDGGKVFSSLHAKTALNAWRGLGPTLPHDRDVIIRKNHDEGDTNSQWQ